MAKRKLDSNEIGLTAGFRFMNFFLKTDYLHYGLWRDEIQLDITNLKQAQQAYSEFLFSFLPENVNYILDVGCGSGRVAHELVKRGYRVDCISPSDELTAFAERLLGDRARIFRGKFEDVNLQDSYDVVMFSESFQYIRMTDSLPRAVSFLKPNGYLLVSDFFRRDGVAGKSPIGGGHSLAEFRKMIADMNLQVIREEDITSLVAPTMDLVNAITMEVVQPLYSNLGALFSDLFPTLSKLARWKYKKQLRKIETKHFGGERSGANFAKYKRYLTLLLKPQPSVRTESLDAREDVVGAFGPKKWLGVLIAGVGVVANGVLQPGGAAMRAAANLACGQISEPALDLVQPGGRSGGGLLWVL